METQNASIAHSKHNHLRNESTVRRDFRNINTQPGWIDDRKSRIIAFVINAGMNITADNFYIEIQNLWHFRY